MRKKISILLLTASLLCGNRAGAAVLNDVNVNTSTGVVVISGELPVKMSGQAVSMEIFDAAVLNEDILSATPDELASMLIAVGQTITDKNGAYSFSFRQVSPTGDYRARISYGSTGRKRERTYKFINAGDIETITDDITALIKTGDASSVTQATTMLDRMGEYMGLNNTLYPSLTDREAAVSAVFAENRNGFDKIADLYSAIERASLMQAVNEAADADTIEGYLENSEAVKNEKAYLAYKNLDNEERAEIAAYLLSQNDYTSTAEWLADIGEKSIIKSIKNAESYGEMEAIIDNYYDIIGLDLTDYNRLGSKKSTVWKEMAGKAYADIGDIEDAFNDAVKDAGRSSQGGQGGGGGSSSGGGGGIGGAAHIPMKNPEPVQNKLFSDIESAEWAREAITALSGSGVVTGYADGSFKPNAPITRAEFATMITKCLGFTNASAFVSFDDVKSGDWFYQSVANGVNAGILSGMSEKYFEPNSKITREQMAAIVYRAAKYTNIELKESAENDFTDSDEISEYAYNAIATLKNSGLIQGVGEGRFDPKGETTRAAACVILNKLMTGGGK